MKLSIIFILGMVLLAISSTEGVHYPYYQSSYQSSYNTRCFPPSNADIKVAVKDDAPTSINFPFKYFGSFRGPIFLDDNGIVTFGKSIGRRNPNPCAPYPDSIPIIAPFWADADFTRVPWGSMSYRISSSSDDLHRATQLIKARFPTKNVALNSVFILTWENASYFGAQHVGPHCPNGGESLRNTLQLALATDGQQSFVIICYVQIQWTTGAGATPGWPNFGLPGHTDVGDTCTGTGGLYAESAFEDGAGTQVKISGDSCKPGVVNIDAQSNINQRGKFVFQVDQEIL